VSFLRNEELKSLTYCVPRDARVLFIGEFSERARAIWMTDTAKFITTQELLVESNRVSEFSPKQRFDYVIISRCLDLVPNPTQLILKLKENCAEPDARFILVYQNWFWRKLKRVPGSLNWTTTRNMELLAETACLEVITRNTRNVFPFAFGGVGEFINSVFVYLPLLRAFYYSKFLVCRNCSVGMPREKLSASIIIPCKNEKGNIRKALDLMPLWDRDIEIIFVEGSSQDGTWEEIQKVIHENNYAFPVKAFKQMGKGKGDAVRVGFDQASKDVLMILDADLTVRPSELPFFLESLETGRGEFINGTRMVFPKEAEAMRFLNYVANYGFSVLFTGLLGQRFTDTLCGTKVLRKNDYLKIAANRDYFGCLDPFGDFDLILGASKLNLKVVEVPIKYKARGYGETQISRFRHGWMLIKMVALAYRKLRV